MRSRKSATSGAISGRWSSSAKCPTDLVVEAAIGADALGARMAGGGFGGSVITLVETAMPPQIQDDSRRVFGAEGFLAPRCFSAMPAPGAGRIGSRGPRRTAGPRCPALR
ncbi:hypothetical protein [Streptomyces sp. NPDC048411]|uniref:hypothetical protein n=1 Tax=Streptomyces sp. NPDC048411 TaxID=3157206 RepID=UPI0034554A7F